MALGVFNIGWIRRCYKRLRKIISGLDSQTKRPDYGRSYNFVRGILVQGR